MRAGVPPERVLLLRADVPGGVKVGSGTLIGPRLVLTAAHVVFTDGGAPAQRVRLGPATADLVDARVLWPRSYDPAGGDCARDAALLEITDRSWIPPRLGPVRWGRLTGRAAGVPCEATGFPRVLRNPDGVRDTDQVAATISPGSRRVAGRYDLEITGSVPKVPTDSRMPSPWCGTSGAGVFASGLLIGIVVVDERGGWREDRLSALPVHRLVADAGFTAAVTGHGGGVLDPAQLASAELVGLLRPVSAAAPSRQQADDSPAGLLLPVQETVPFHGRRAVMTHLLDWCTSPEQVSIRLLLGPGGQGKTRLARRLAQQLAGRTGPDGSTWVTGLLADPVSDSAPPGLDVLADTDGSLLVVVDDAEARTTQIARLMTAVAGADTSTRTRVLLVARTFGSWWDPLAREDLALTAPRTIELDGLAPSAEPAAGYPAAVAAIAGRLAAVRPGRDWRTLAATVQSPPDVATNPAYAVPLTLQMTALSALLEAADPLGRRAEPVEATLLSHERNYWRAVARAEGLDLSAATMGDCVTAGTLCGAVSAAQARAVTAAIPSLGGQPRDVLRRVDSWLRGLYPPAAGRHWGALGPDRLAEFHTATALLDDEELLPALLAAADSRQLEQALAVLGRTAVHPCLTRDQAETLSAQMGRCFLELVRTRLPSLTSTAVHALNVRPALLLALGRSEEAAAATGVATAWYGQLAETHPTEFRPPLAEAWARRAEAMRDLDRPQDALSAADRAIAAYRALAAAGPELATVLLAACLLERMRALESLQRPVEALASLTEAIDLYQRLADAHPGIFTEVLAAARQRASLQLAARSRMDRAAEQMTRAGRLYEQLATARPAEFAGVLAQVRADEADMVVQARRQRDAIDRLLHSTQPLADAAASVVRGSGGAGAGRRLDRELSELEHDPQWTALVTVIRRITAGDTDRRLLDDLDPAQAAVAAAVLDRLRH